MPERAHSCNYGPRQALEVFDYLIWVNIHRKRWLVSEKDLPPSRSPLRRLVTAVLKDLQRLGVAKTRKLAVYLPKRKWKYLFNCQWVCSRCRHRKRCPLAILFQSKGWSLEEFLGGEGDG